MRGDRHQHDRHGEADNEDKSVALGRAGDGQHVVERHRHVGDGDEADGGPEAEFGMRLLVCTNVSVMIAGGDLAVHFPAHPQQQDAAGERQADDGEQLHGDRGKEDAQHDRRGDAPEDHPAANFLGNARGGKTDDDGVVARQHQVDHDDVDEGDEVLAVPVQRDEMLRFFNDGPEHHAEVLQQPVHLTRPVGTLPAQAATSYFPPARVCGIPGMPGQAFLGPKSDGPPWGGPP